MSPELKRLIQLPEYQAFDRLLEGCRRGLREKGDEFAAKMKLYAVQYANGQISEDELAKSVQGLEYPLKAWIQEQNIFRRRRMIKLVDAAVRHLTATLVEAIKSQVLPFI